MRSSLPLRGYSSGSGIIPLQQHDQSIVDVEFGKAKDAPSSTFFLCPYFRLWATPSSMRLACGRPLSRSRKFILAPSQLPCPKQAPVYPRAGLCRGRGSLPDTRNDRDLSCTRPNFAGGRSRPQTGACLPSRRLRGLKQAPVYFRAGLCRGREVYSGTRPSFPAPVGALFSDTKSRSMVLAKFEVLQPPRRPQPPPSQLNEPTAVWGKPSGCRCGWRRWSGGLPRWRTRCCGCGAARRDSVR